MTQKTYYFFIIIALFFFECKQAKTNQLELLNNYIQITDAELRLLDSINTLIIKHFEDLKARNEEQYSKENKMNLTAFLIRKGLGSDSVMFDKYRNEFYNRQLSKNNNQLQFDYMLINPIDTTIDFGVKSYIDQAQKIIIVEHRLLNRRNVKAGPGYKKRQFVKEKELTPNWTYYITNEEYLGR